MISEKAVKIHVEFYSFLYRIEVDETSLREFAAKLQGHELMRRCSERMELTLDDPKRAIPVLDAMGFTSYQVTDKEHIHIFERLSESASLNMELAKAGIPVKGISITSEELEAYFLNLTGGASHA